MLACSIILMGLVTSIMMMVSGAQSHCAMLSSELKDYQGGRGNMNNAESFTVRLIIGHCGNVNQGCSLNCEFQECRT